MLDLSFETVFYGPNVFSPSAALVASIRVSEASAPGEIALGCLRLRTLWPEWIGQDVRIADDSTGAAQHIAAWALGALNEVRGFLHHSGAQTSSQRTWLWVEFHHPGVTKMALELAKQALTQAMLGEEGSSREALSAALQNFWTFCRRHHPDYQARILMEGARERGVPFLPFVAGSRYWQYGWGARSRVFLESSSNADGLLGGQWQKSKALSHAVFASLGAPTPAHRLVSKAEELNAVAQAVGWPCVVKPIDRGGGRGVTAGITSTAALRVAFDYARQYTAGPVMVEAFVPGDDHRLMVVEGRLVAAIRRQASSVTGDGVGCVRELLSVINLTRSPNMRKSGYLRPIPVDDYLVGHLAGQGLTLEDVPEQGRVVTLRSNSNLSSGGVCIDVTDEVHPAVRQLAESVVQAFGLATAGLDYITTDIGGAPVQTGGCLIEVNTVPGLDAVIAAGWAPAKISTTVLGTLPGRIPVTLIVLPDAMMARAVEDLRAHSPDPAVGWVCGVEGTVGGLPLQGIDSEPWAAVRTALRHRALEALAVLCTPTELMRHGLPLSKMERAVICGVHLPSNWDGVLHRCVSDVERLDGWAQYVDRLRGER